MEWSSPIRGRRRSPRRVRARASLSRALAGPAAAVAYPGFAEPDPGDGATRFLSASLLLHGAVIAGLAIFASLATDLDVAPLRVQLLKEEQPPPPPPEPEPEAVAETPEPPPVPVAIPAPPPVAKPEPLPAEPAPEPPPPPRRAPPPRIDPLAALPEPVAPPALPREHPVREMRRPSRPSPELAFAPGPALAVPAAPGPVRSVRERPALPTLRTRPRPPGAVAPAPPAHLTPPPAAAPVERPRPRPVRTSAAPRRPAPVAPRRAPEARPDIRGVALGSLAPCVTDARERALKQRVVATGRNRALCESPAGRFHLLETKNVNAFLMRIERAPGRAAGDRCRELALALDCLASR